MGRTSTFKAHAGACSAQTHLAISHTIEHIQADAHAEICGGVDARVQSARATQHNYRALQLCWLTGARAQRPSCKSQAHIPCEDVALSAT